MRLYSTLLTTSLYITIISCQYINPYIPTGSIQQQSPSSSYVQPLYTVPQQTQTINKDNKQYTTPPQQQPVYYSEPVNTAPYTSAPNQFDTALNNINKNQQSLNEQLKSLYNIQQFQQKTLDTLVTRYNDIVGHMKRPVDLSDRHSKINNIQNNMPTNDRLNNIENQLNQQHRLIQELTKALTQPRDGIDIHSNNIPQQHIDTVKNEKSTGWLDNILHPKKNEKIITTQQTTHQEQPVVDTLHHSRYNDLHAFVTQLGVQRGLSHRLSHILGHVLLLGFLSLMLLIPILLVYSFLSNLLRNNNNKTQQINIHQPPPQRSNIQYIETRQQTPPPTLPTAPTPNERITYRERPATGNIKIRQVDNGTSTYPAAHIDRKPNQYHDNTFNSNSKSLYADNDNQNYNSNNSSNNTTTNNPSYYNSNDRPVKQVSPIPYQSQQQTIPLETYNVNDNPKFTYNTNNNNNTGANPVNLSTSSIQPQTGTSKFVYDPQTNSYKPKDYISGNNNDQKQAVTPY